MKISTNKSASLFPTLVFTLLATCSSTLGLAQGSPPPPPPPSVKKEIHKSKTVKVEEVNNEAQVTVTTIENGEKTVVIYKGVEAEKYLENHIEKSVEDVQVRTVRMKSVQNMEDMEFHMDVEGMEKGETRKIIVVSQGDDEQGRQVEKSVWNSDENHSFEMEDMDVNITDGENGESIKIEMKYTDENGERVEKIMEFDEEQITKTIEDAQELLNDLNIDIDLNIEMDQADAKEAQTVIIKKKIVIEDEETILIDEDDSEMLSHLEISPNPSRGMVRLEFEPSQAGKVKISVDTIDGMNLYTDSYDGDGKYSKNIKLNEYSGVVLITIHQGNEVEVRKVIVQ